MKPLRPVIEQLALNDEFGAEFQVQSDFWEELDNILSALKAPYIATKNMQRVGYGLADFRVSWLRMEKNLTRNQTNGVGGDLPQKLLEAMKRRESVLLATPIMLTAMYLDPRIKYKLSDTQKACAILSLEKLHCRLVDVEKDATNLNVFDNNDTLDELNAEALAECGGIEVNGNNNGTQLNDFRTLITKYDCVQHTDMKANVMDFWKKHKKEFPLLYDLACVVHSVHAGQCCVEQNFSSFSYIRECHRIKLMPSNITNILLIRLNREVFEEWKQNEIDKIHNSK